jgi:hypothetical protein
MCYMPAHITLFNLIILIIYGEYKLWRASICVFPTTSYYLIALRCKYSPQHPVLKHLQSMFFPNVRDKVPHPYKTKGNTVVLHILIFTFLYGMREDKIF